MHPIRDLHPLPPPAANKLCCIFLRSSARIALVNSARHLPARKILVIDDNRIDRDVLSRLLGAAGHRVFEAGDGPAAFSLARRVRPELILLDVFFPPDTGQSGNTWDAFMMIDWFRRMGVIEDTPVIVISGAEQADFRDRCLASDVVAFFSKPIIARELLDTVRRVLESRACQSGSKTGVGKDDLEQCKRSKSLVAPQSWRQSSHIL